MAEIDFVTALGRLLDNLQLRQAFREDRARAVEELNVCATDRETVERLVPDELEFQARILLRKRLKAIQRSIPKTCERLGDRLWTTFADYSATTPSQTDPKQDAYRFAEYVAETAPATASSSELNCLRFEMGNGRFCLRFTRDAGALMLGGSALQVFVRRRGGQCSEWRLGIRSYP